MSRQFTKEFKEDAVRYYLDHKDLGLTACAKNLGTSKATLCTWTKESRANNEKYLLGDLVITKVMTQKKMQDYAKN
ncbi:hypothetical protein [Clostridium algidicarnis]|uniref:hypothetical protein n=1 Tax=Clostridium algidicarnis TaxID=37659 RepID=UPI003FD70167